MKNSYHFTSESVTEGHPDKMADQISDAILDDIIARDKNARVACETLLSNGFCVIAGELKTTAYTPMQDIVRRVVKDIGYTNSAYGFDSEHAAVLNGIGEQSVDINQGVDRSDGELGAGDQGLMFGYACRETNVLMPLPITLAHKLAYQLAKVRKDGTIKQLRPDGKTQVTVRYENDTPVGIDSVVVSTQHDDDFYGSALEDAIRTHVLRPILENEEITGLKGIKIENIEQLINPSGRFVIGGPKGDAGLTGRKIIVDTYGGSCPHGGGAFSGKDPTKVDRSAAYMARYIAKNLVASKVCDKAVVQLSYAIGHHLPVSVYVNTYGTGKVSDEVLSSCVREVFSLTPRGIIDSLDLVRPIYLKTAAYGHFGREEPEFTWERCDKVDAIKDFVKGR